MAGGEDWVMLPVLRGLCVYKDLKDGSLSLYDVALMNEALEVEGENQRRLRGNENGNR